MMFPAGKYWVGDLCYVMHNEWDEVCKLTIKDNECLEGVFTLANGTRFAMFKTAWGDGCYEDQTGREYAVDSGSIGCVAVDAITEEEIREDLGNIIEFTEPFYVSTNGEELRFGKVYIDTNPEYHEAY
jgi:hypothetical protein